MAPFDQRGQRVGRDQTNTDNSLNNIANMGMSPNTGTGENAYAEEIGQKLGQKAGATIAPMIGRKIGKKLPFPWFWRKR